MPKKKGNKKQDSSGSEDEVCQLNEFPNSHALCLLRDVKSNYVRISQATNSQARNLRGLPDYRSLCSSVLLRRLVAKQSASRIALTENSDLTIAGMTFVFRGKRAMGSLMKGWPTLLWILGTLSR